MEILESMQVALGGKLGTAGTHMGRLGLELSAGAPLEKASLGVYLKNPEPT